MKKLVSSVFRQYFYMVFIFLSTSICAYLKVPRVTYFNDPIKFKCSPVQEEQSVIYPLFTDSGNSDLLGKKLVYLIQQSDPKPFQQLLEQIVGQYRGNHELFFRIINTRDQDGYNILLRSAIIGDLENVEKIFDALEKFYGSDKERLFEYLDTRDKIGIGVLSLSTYDGGRKTVELVLIRTMMLFGNNKNLFFKFLTAAEYEHKWRPLGDMADEAQSYNMRMTVQLAAFVLGKNSKLFDQFINAEDAEGYTALNSAQTDNDRLFLYSYGAVDKSPKEDDVLIFRADEYGRQLRKAGIGHNDDLFKKILDQATMALKSDPNAWFHVVTERDEGGWNAFMHAAAEGRLNQIIVMFEIMEKYLPPAHSDYLYLLLSTTDYEGRTPLHMAITRRYYDVALYIVDKLMKYSDDKTEILPILNAHDELNGFTPLFNAVYSVYEFDATAYNFLTQLIAKIAHFYGPKSRMFWLWLNARDYNKESPINYTTDDAIIKLLKKYGAVDRPMKKIKGIGLFESMILNNEL